MKDGETTAAWVSAKRRIKAYFRENGIKFHYTKGWTQTMSKLLQEITGIPKHEKHVLYHIKAAKSLNLKGRDILGHTPEWSDKDKIKEIYLEARKLPNHHVDHIIPIQGKNVCGLHVSENLQILPAVINIRKSNKFS